MWRRTFGTAALAVLGVAGTLEGQAADPSLTMGPWYFEENRGQFETAAAFVGRDGGMRAFVEGDAITLQLVSLDDGEEALHGVNLRLVFEDASPDTRVEGSEELPGIVNYFMGSDPAGWHTQIPTFANVAVRGLYPGIDLVVRGGARGRLEYDLEIAPGADLEAVKIRLEGQDGVSLLDDRVVLLHTPLGSVRQDIPASWERLPDGTRRSLDARWARLDVDRLGLDVPGHDPSLPLVIDPGLVWSTFLGGSRGDGIEAIAIDGTGATIVAGQTASSNFPTTPGAFDTSFNGAPPDAFVAKLNSTGQTLLWATYLGGFGNDQLYSLAVDATGGATVVGFTSSSNYPTTPGAFDTTNNGDDGIVSRLSPDGTALSYSTFLGGTSGEYAVAVAVDGGGTPSVFGKTSSPNFPTTAGTFSAIYGGGSSDCFVSRLSSSGNSLLYSTFLGGSNSEGVVGPVGAHGMVVDAGGVITVAWESESSDFPTTPGSFQPAYVGNGDAFVARLDPSQSAAAQLVYSTFLGGGEYDIATAIALSASSEVTVLGYSVHSSLGPPFPTTPGAFDTIHNTNSAFVSRLSSSGQTLVWSTLLESAGNQPTYPKSLALDATSGSVVTVSSGIFPVTIGAYNTGLCLGCAYVARLSPMGNALFYSTRLGESTDLAALAVDAMSVATVAGGTASANYPTTAGSYQTIYNGGVDACITRLDLLPTGAVPFGAPTPGCSGPLPIGVTSIPQVGNAGFAITCGNAPANATGILAVSGAGLTAPLLVFGAQVWIDLGYPLLPLLFVPSNGIGAAEVPLGIPAGAAFVGVQAYAQFFWPDPCAPGGVSASNALAITVQP